MSLTTAAPKSGEISAAHAGRLQLVYAAHQELEEALDTMQAYMSAAKKYHQSTTRSDEDGCGFSPWAGVQESAERCVDKASRCLRLFNPTRKVAHLKGMATMTLLYGTPAAKPQDRVVAFMKHLEASFEGELPLEVALCGGRCLQRLDAAATDDYLVDCLHHLLLPLSRATAPAPPPAETDNADTADTADISRAPRDALPSLSPQQRYRACLHLDCDSAVYQTHLRALLLLQVEAAAQAGHDAHKLAAAFDARVMGEALPAATCEELVKYETVCWREAERVRAVEAASRASPTTNTTTTTFSSSGVVVKEKSAAAVATTTQPTSAVEGRHTGAVASPFAGLSQWKWHAVRIAVLLLLALLVRFASGPLARALKSVLQVSHTAQSRRRTLTL
jgi:hypothetical protein